MPHSSVAYDVIKVQSGSTQVNKQSQRVYDLAAVAEKNLADDYDGLVLRAVARSAMKMAAAEGIGLGARAAAGRNHRDWIGPLVGGIARIFALATEEADTRTWRTLPGEIELTRVWVKPGDSVVGIQSMDHDGREVGEDQRRPVSLTGGETLMLIHQYWH